MVEGPDEDTTSNVVIGDVFGTVVQTGHIHGDLHVHEAPVRRRSATIAHRLAKRPPWLAAVLGSPGLLVDSDRVITCADVPASVQVSFPHGHLTREAAVVERHQDLVVLRLAEPVPLTPAPLSTRESLRSTTSDGIVFDHDLEAVVGLVASDGRTVSFALPWLHTGWRLDLDAALHTHWLPRARGSEVESDSGDWYFTGREAARQAICDWLASDEPLLVVTGGPGSGKSAVLAHVLVAADRPVPTPGPLPPHGAFDIAVHASGLTRDEVLSRLAAGTDLDAHTTAELIVALREHQRTPVILVDAVEEAATVDAARDIATLLRELTDSGVARVLAAVRTSPAGSERARILTAFGRSAPRIDLDSPQYLHEPDVVDYVRLRLPQLSSDQALAIATRAQHNFLIAQLTTRWLARHDTFDVDELPETVGQALDRYLDACGPDRVLVRRVLTALAFARGEGLSRDNAWLTIADALHSGHEHTLLDLDKVFQSAANYLVERHDGQYRLYHRALDEHLQEQCRSPEVAITKALAEAGRRDWREANRYTLRHLPDHAATAGLLDDLLDDTAFLVHAEPAGLLASLRHTTTRRGRLISSIYRVSQHLHINADASTRRRQLAIDAARFRADDLRDELNALAEASWQVRFATGQGVSPATVAMLTGHNQMIHQIVTAGVDEQTVAFSFGSDAVRAWHLADLGQMASFEGDVTSIAATVWRGTPVALVGLVDGTVRLWDPAEDHEVGLLPCPDGENAVTDIIVVEDVIVTAHRAPGWNGLTLWLWDLRSLELIGSCHTDLRRANRVRHIAVTSTGTRLIAAVTGFDDDQVDVLDLDAGSSVGQARMGRIPFSFTTTEIDGTVIAFSTWRSVISSWDLLDQRKVGELSTADDTRVLSVTAVHRDGRPVLLTGLADGSVRMWDIERAELISELRTGHDDVSIVAVAEVHGRFLALTASQPYRHIGLLDHRLGVLDLDSVAISGFVDPSTGAVHAVAISEFEGASVMLTRRVDPPVHLWDIANQQHMHDIRVRKDRCLLVQATGTPPLAALGEADIWDLDRRRRVGGLRLRQSVQMISMAECDGAAMLVVGDSAFLDVWTVTPKQSDWALAGAVDLRRSPGQYVSSAAIGRINGRLVVVVGFTASPSYDGATQALEVWDPVSVRRVVRISTGHRDGVVALALATVSSNLFAATGGDDALVRIWNLSTGRPHGAGLAGHEDGVTSAVMGSLHGRPTVITGSYDRTIRLWDVESQECVEVVRLPAAVTCLAIGGRGTLVFGQGSDVVAMDAPGLTALTPSQRPL